MQELTKMSDVHGASALFLTQSAYIVVVVLYCLIVINILVLFLIFTVSYGLQIRT